MSSKPLSNPDAGSMKRKKNESEFIAPSKKSIPAESMAAKTRRSGEHKVRERRNGYQMISTASYYRTERRGAHAQDWLAAKTEVEGLPGMDGTPYNVGDSDH